MLKLLAALILAALLLGVASSQQEQGGLSIVKEQLEGEDGAAAADASAAVDGCPVSCFRTDPVCGSDGVTYWCGSKDAQCSGVEVAHAGFCNPGNGVVGGKGVMAGQALLIVHLVWLFAAAISIFFGVP